jgi:predicted dehydrogenase
MVAAARKAGKLLQIGHQRRSNPVYGLTLDAIRKGELCGRLTNCYGQWARPVQSKLTWPEKYEIPRETLAKYGYKSMEEFRNWRWYRKYSAGPIADLGSHQIDMFSWFLHAEPSSLMAVAGKDYYKDREWYEDVLVVYEYATKAGSARAFYQVLNTNSYGHYYERFRGDKGTLTISENPKKCYYVPEPAAKLPEWMGGVETEKHDGYENAVPLMKALPLRNAAAKAAMERWGNMNPHEMHLENFYNAVRANDKSMLTCPAEVAYPTAVAVLSVIPAIEAGGKRRFTEADYKA